nr:Ig domain-containing protein [Nocardioides luti]
MGARTRVRRSEPGRARVLYDTVIAKDTRVVPGERVQDVTAQPDGTQLLEVSGPPTATAGSVLVLGTSAATPSGLVARVQDVDESAGGTAYTLVPAKLTEAFTDLSFSQQVKVDLTETTAVSASTGRRISARGLASLIKCDTGADFSVTRSMTGSLALTFSAGFDATNPQSSFLRAEASADLTAVLGAHLDAAGTCAIARQQLGPSIRFTPITFSIGPVPVVIVPTLEFFGEASASLGTSVGMDISGSLTTSAWAQASMAGGLTHGFNPPAAHFSKDIDYPQDVTGQLKGQLSARLTTELYGVAGPYVEVNTGPQVTFAPTQVPWLNAEHLLSVDIGLSMQRCAQLWGADLCVKFEAEADKVVDKSWPLFRRDYFAGPTISSAKLAPAVRGQQYTAGLTTTDNRPGSWRIAGGALPSGMSLSGSKVVGTPAKTGSYAVTIRFTDSEGRTDDQDLSLTVLDGASFKNKIITSPTGKSYLIDADLQKHSIATTWTYFCLVDRGLEAVAVEQTQIDGFPAGPAAKDCVSPARVEGQIIRRNDGISWVVVGGERHHIPSKAVDVCARAVHRRAVGLTGLSGEAAASIPESTTKYDCSIEGTVVQALDKPQPYPAYRISGGKRYWIADGWTFDYWKRRVPVVASYDEAAIKELPDGGTETSRLDPAAIPANSIIRRNDGISWVVDANKVRHHIPYARDDTCWRRLRGFAVTATGLSGAQASSLTEGDAWPCVVGPRVVKSDDGASYFVDGSNTRHWIPDTETFAALSRSYEVVGPWPADEVQTFLPGTNEPTMLDPEAVKNTLVCRNDGVCWAVDGNAVRHHVPTYGDNVCWRWVNGWHVSRNGVSGEQANSLAEGDAWGCSMNDRIVVTNEGPAYYMEGNTRRWIPDGYDFECLQRGRSVIRGMAMSEAGNLPETGAMPAQECSGIDIVTIYSPANSRYVTTEVNYTGNDQAMVRAERTAVGSDWERFRLIGDCASRCLIQSLVNRRLVMPQFDYQGYAWGEMRGVSSNASGSWEGFRLVGNCSTGCAIYALGNGRYVSAELDYTGKGYGMLRARATSVGGWERFLIR